MIKELLECHNKLAFDPCDLNDSGVLLILAKTTLGYDFSLILVEHLTVHRTHSHKPDTNFLPP